LALKIVSGLVGENDIIDVDAEDGKILIKIPEKKLKNKKNKK